MQRHSSIDRMRANLDRALALRREAATDVLLARRRATVRAWQAARLTRTHADLLADRRYRAGARFFLSDLYGMHSLDARDAQLEQVLPLMTRLLPARAMETLGLAIEVDALSEKLDRALAQALYKTQQIDRPISDASYASAYRMSSARSDREHQIDLIFAVGRNLERIAGKPLLRHSVRAMRGPARRAGYEELQSFLERGLKSFHAVADANEFLRIIVERERLLVDRLFSEVPAPFDLSFA